MRVQDLRDTDYARKHYLSHKRGWFSNWRWEYCITKRISDPWFRALLVAGGTEEPQGVCLMLGLLGFSAYLTFPHILPERLAVGWFEKDGVRNLRWHEDSHGRQYGVTFTDAHLCAYWGATVAAGGNDPSKYGYSWNFDMPWDWGTCVRWEVQRQDGSWGPHSYELQNRHLAELRKTKPDASILDVPAAMGFPDGRKIYRAPYRYYRTNGQVQIRRVEFYVCEMEWRWKLLRRWNLGPKRVRRYIDVTFDEGVGERVDTWKGGVTGCSFEMNPGETPKDCIRRMEREQKFL